MLATPNFDKGWGWHCFIHSFISIENSSMCGHRAIIFQNYHHRKSLLLPVLLQQHKLLLSCCWNRRVSGVVAGGRGGRGLHVGRQKAQLQSIPILSLCTKRSNRIEQHSHLHLHQQRYYPFRTTTTTTTTTRQSSSSSSSPTTLSSSKSSILSEAIEQRLLELQQRHDEILREMKTAGHTSPQLGKEFASLQHAMTLLEEREKLRVEIVSLQELLQEVVAAVDDDDNDNNEELSKECQMELTRLLQQLEVIEERLVDAALPTDPFEDTSSDAVVEVRAGTGGDEASLFASELIASYTKMAQALQWRVETLSESKTDIGGIREASLAISGSPSFAVPSSSTNSNSGGGNDEDNTTIPTPAASSASASASATLDEILLGPYGVFQFESGVHRVQRVPVNDSRIHTSACSVAVLPYSSANPNSNCSNNEQLLPLAELKIETMRSSGAGGQHVNTTDSACRITHLPTGITVKIQKERSQHRNKELALKLITARVQDVQRQQQERAAGETRSSLMGGGDRSERIRTYNFPQDRVTDHRSKETRYGIDQLLNGGSAFENMVVAFLPLLRSLHRKEKLEQLQQKTRTQK